MRILINGPTGTQIDTAVESLKQTFLKEENVSEKYADSVFKVYPFEEELKQQSHIPLNVYLDKDDFSFQEYHYSESLKNILTHIEKDNPKHSIISMNYPFFRDDRVFPAFSIDLIKKLNPSMVITLIDDALACWARIFLRRKKDSDRSYFRLRDMFTWRSTSILFGRIFAKTLGIPAYLVSVKHPPQMLYKLIFKSNEIVRTYASYPISSVRDVPNDRQVMDNFRMRMHNEFCTFDPVTIDDRRVSVDSSVDSKTMIEITKESRWPLPSNFSMVSEDDIWNSKEKLEISAEQLREVLTPLSFDEKSIVDKHIMYRDFRLISDSNVVIANRPFYKKHPSRGVSSEIQYATQTAGRECFMLWNPDEDGDQSSSPFAGKGTFETDIEKIINTVKNRKF